MGDLFRRDALRWVTPGQVADPSVLTMPLLLQLLNRHMPLRAMAWFRFGRWCKQKRIPFLCGLTLRWILFRFGLEIGGTIGGGMYIAHPVGCVIHAKTIGENCSIVAATTIGMRNEWAFPQIGDNVFVGAGARVLGDIHVGDNVKIGANAVVIHDVPDDTTVVGIPARAIEVHRRQSSTHRFVGNGSEPIPELIE